MKKAIFPIICAVLIPFVLSRINSNIQPAGLVLAVFFGLAIGAGINKIFFKKEN